MRLKPVPPLDDLTIQYIGSRMGPVLASGCRMWIRRRPRVESKYWISDDEYDAYGIVNLDGRTYPAHRVVYTAFKGTIPDGYVVDHTCRVKNCVNPDHLEAVTITENNLRESPRWRNDRRRELGLAPIDSRDERSRLMNRAIAQGVEPRDLT